MSGKTAVKVGDNVRFQSGKVTIIGQVIEDRGPLGVKGRQLYRIRYPIDPDIHVEVEMPADEFEVVRDQASAG